MGYTGFDRIVELVTCKLEMVLGSIKMNQKLGANLEDFVPTALAA